MSSRRRPEESGALQIFVLDVDRRPTLAFEAPDLAEAREICSDADLRTDLMALTTGGVPVCAAESSLAARAAAPDEIVAFRRAVARAPASDQPTMSFLIEIDGVMVVAVDPDQV